MFYYHLVSGRSSLPSLLRVYFLVTVSSTRVTAVMILLHAVSVYLVMSLFLRIVRFSSHHPPLVPVPPLPRSMSSFLLFLRVHHLCYHCHLLSLHQSLPLSCHPQLSRPPPLRRPPPLSLSCLLLLFRHQLHRRHSTTLVVLSTPHRYLWLPVRVP